MSYTLASLVIVCAMPRAVAAVPPTAEDYAAPPAIAAVDLSPSGRRMAILVQGNDGRHRLGVMDLDPIGSPRVIAAFSNANITRSRWVNDERLVFEAFEDGHLVRAWGAGTFAVNHDGSDQRQLIAWAHHTEREGSLIASRILPYGWFLHRTLDDGSADVLVRREVRDARDDVVEIQLSRLDTVTRRIQSLSLEIPDYTRRWLLDAKDQPRMTVAVRNGRRSVHWRDPEGAKWVEVDNVDWVKDDGFEPLRIEPDDSVIVSARVGGDTEALYRWDPKSRSLDREPLVHVAGFDVTAVLEADLKSRRVLGVHTVLDRPVSLWFDASMQGLQQALDAALPKDRFNRIYCGRCESSRFFVIRSSSDRQPGEFFLFDKRKGTLERLGQVRPRVDEATQGRRSFHRIRARDGLMLPLYVTDPPGAAPKAALPAVVLVHGGPWVRGASLAWSKQAQFLATRGYRVLEPEFRGSDGYGFKHFRASWKQWGTTMQDDLVDAVRWAAERSLIDPARVCVVGASYGGYAALMAPIAHPSVFRCAASFAGVTDINLMYDLSWSDLSEEYKRYGMPSMIGDQRADAAMLDAASPLKRVAELKIPVLLTHGGLDRRVPIDHARVFENAARKAGVVVESHVYPDEGHGFNRSTNEADHFKRLERFLAQHLQPASPSRESRPNTP